jgi:membrane-associated phospholipid phosphatase
VRNEVTEPPAVALREADARRSVRAHVLMVIAVVFAVAFLWLAIAAAEREYTTVDQAVQALLRSQRGPRLDLVMQALSRLGSGYVVVPLAALSCAVLWRRGRRRPWLIAALTGGSIHVEAQAKWLVHRPRPKGGGYGFPSGHVVVCVVFLGLMLHLMWTAERPVRGRWAWTAAAGLFLVSVGYSRLHLNSHWTTDTLGGVTMGVAYLATALAWIEEDKAAQAFRSR